jgi:hypothetical protein
MSALSAIEPENGAPSRPISATKVLSCRYGRQQPPNLGPTNDFVCAIGEFLAMGMFYFFALGETNFAGFRPTLQFLFDERSDGQLNSALVLYI